jgi:ribose 5-phosphate isomerase B
MHSELADSLQRRVRSRGHEVVTFGALQPGADDEWTSVARAVGEAVSRGEYDQGILCCWTGTGVSIAANKVPGVRAALCGDAPTAAGAREWNDANVLCLSVRATSVAVAKEILDAWFAASATTDPKYRAIVERLVAEDTSNAV